MSSSPLRRNSFEFSDINFTSDMGPRIGLFENDQEITEASIKEVSKFILENGLGVTQYDKDKLDNLKIAPLTSKEVEYGFNVINDLINERAIKIIHDSFNLNSKRHVCLFQVMGVERDGSQNLTDKVMYLSQSAFDSIERYLTKSSEAQHSINITFQEEATSNRFCSSFYEYFNFTPNSYKCVCPIIIGISVFACGFFALKLY